MKWKNVLLWAFVSLTFMFVLSTLGGLLYGIVVASADVNGDANPAFSGLLAMFVFFRVFFIYFLQIIGILFLATTLWALISMKYPKIEKEKWHKLVLGIYSLCFGAFFWAVFPIAPIYAFWGGVFISLSIFLPRLFIKKLSDGTIISKPSPVELETTEG
jgi:hypothetical protein